MTIEPLGESTVIARTPDAVEGDLPAETVLLHVGTGKALRLNGTGAWIWHNLAEPTSIGALATGLADRHEISSERALEDVLAFAGELAERGFVEVPPPG